MSTARDLADRFHERWLEQNPFAASMYGVPGYDDLVPDESEEGARARRAEAEGFVAEADEIAAGPLTPADAVTLECTREAAAQEIAIVDMAPGGPHGHGHAVLGSGAAHGGRGPDGPGRRVRG